MKKIFTTLMMGWVAAGAASGQSLQRVLYVDALDRAGSTAMGQMQNRDGLFLSGQGWQAVSATSQLMITLPEPLPESGTLMVDVRNFDPVRQNIDVKQQIINLYSQANGSKAIFESDGSWINIRTGTGYSAGEGQAGFKMLAAPRGIDSRDEVRIMEDATWDPGRTYEFKITWDSTGAAVWLDGQHCFTLPFAGQVERFRHLFLGTDNVYVAQPGVIYSNLRLLGSSEASGVLKSLGQVRQPLSASLLPNHPNPFNPATTLAFEVRERTHLSLQIVNLFGQIVTTLTEGERAPGLYRLEWDGADQQGIPASGGVYFARLITATGQSTRRMTMLK